MNPKTCSNFLVVSEGRANKHDVVELAAERAAKLVHEELCLS